jgi:hypothetical protein
MTLFTKILPGSVTYTGAELKPQWIAEQTGHFGDALVAFRGPCHVKSSEMVDVEDSRRNLFIESKEMLHFLGENFHLSLDAAIGHQRLLIANFVDLLTAELPAQFRVGRQGDDIFIRETGNQQNLKLSVSVVTATAVSTLIHFGVNIDASGAPVPAIGLMNIGIDPDVFVQKVLTRWIWEFDSMYKARCKVTPR